MTIDRKDENGIVTLALNGRLDTTTSPQLQGELLPVVEEASEINLDFSQLAYVSSAGLRVLLMAQKAANAKGATMAVCNVSAEIMEVFDMTGFSDILDIK